MKQHSLSSIKSSNNYSSFVDAQYSAPPVGRKEDVDAHYSTPPVGLGEDIDAQAKPNQFREPQVREWPRSKYSDVSVLLLRWADDNLGVIQEVTKLRDLLQSRFHFSAEIWDIPSDDPEDELTRKILLLRKGKQSDSLIILYYAGHGGGDTEECIWLANNTGDSPWLNWHNVQGHLLGHACDTLFILDCCYASLAASNHSTGNNWFLGASAKESEATGVSWKSFTSAMTRSLKRAANKYWTDREKYDTHSLSYDLNIWERDLEVTPNFVPLNEHFCGHIDLTPLLYAGARPMLASARTEPVVSQPHELPRKPSFPHRPRKDYVPPSGGSPVPFSHRSDGQEDSRTDMVPIEISVTADCQTVRISGLPRDTAAEDVTDWLRGFRLPGLTNMPLGPIVQHPPTGTNTMTITLPSIALAKQVLKLDGEEFAAGRGRQGHQVTIDMNFMGLTTIYSSVKGPHQEPNVDIVFVHGAYGHPINSFASHYGSPRSGSTSAEICWPRDELPKLLELGGVFPRVLTFGWPAEGYWDPDVSIGKTVDDFLIKLRDLRRTTHSRPLILVGHGVGGFFVKEAVNSIINSSFSDDRFENPVKACYFLAVPHRGVADAEDFATILAAMKTMSIDSPPIQKSRLGELASHNRTILNLSTEYESICQEWGIKNISIAETSTAESRPLVPEMCAFLDKAPEDRIEINGGHRDLSRLSRTARLSRTETTRHHVLQQISSKIIHQINPGQSAVNQRDLGVAKKTEQVFARLKKYDTVFLVDDSESMSGRRWKTTCKVLADIASIAVKYDRDGVDIRFFNNYLEDDTRKHLNTSEKVMDLFSKTQPEGPTLTEDILVEELNEYMYEYQQDRHKKGLNLIVLTDGEPDRGQDVEGVIVKYAKELREAKAPPFQIGIQFVQIGNDPMAAEFLDFLDRKLKGKHNLDRDMVDTVRWVSGDEDRLFEKILLGGVLKRLDDDDEPDKDG